MNNYTKLERDGKIAVLYSPGFGGGWWTWNPGYFGLLFDSEVVEAVLKKDYKLACEIAERKYPNVYTGGGDQLEVAWVPKGTQFTLTEYDGSETIHVYGDEDYHTA